MSIIRDGIFKLAAVATENLTVTLAAAPGTTFESEAIDTTGFDRGLAIFFQTNRDLVAVDDEIEYNFQESENGTTGWTDVNPDGILPTWKQPGNRFEIINTTQVKYLQPAGVFNAGPFIRVQLIKWNITASDVIVTLIPVLCPTLNAFNGWANTPPPNDDLP